MDDIEGPPKCLEGVSHQTPAPQWHIRGKAQSRLECGLGVLHVSPPWVEGPVLDQIGLLALNEYGSRVINILNGSVCNIGWCIVGRQAIWWEGILTLDLHKIGATRTSQCFASLAYHI